MITFEVGFKNLKRIRELVGKEYSSQFVVGTRISIVPFQVLGDYKWGIADANLALGNDFCMLRDLK